MFKAGRKKVVKSKDTATFKLELHASHVPLRGWDKLQVSLVYVDSGKVTNKTGKTPVKNGTCQWSEPLFEVAPISQDANGKELYKLVVSMGLSRFGVLGDTIINLMEYLHSTTPVMLSLPLQNCNFGSILHVKLQRVLPKSLSEDLEDQKESVHPDMKPIVPDGDPPIVSEMGPLGDSGSSYEVNSPASNKGDAFLNSPSSHSFDSIEVPSTPIMEEAHLPGREVTGDEEFISLSSSASSSGRHELGTIVYDGEFPSAETLSMPGPGAENPSFSPQHSRSSPEGSSRLSREWNSPDLNLQGSSAGYEDKNKWEASQRRTRLQRTASVAMPSSWEHEGNQATRTVAGIEALKQQLAEETRRSEEVNQKLSMLIAERNSIKQEMEELRAREVPPSVMSREWQRQLEEEASRQVKDLQDELDYVKGRNMNLNLQLEKTQESNSELLLEIQDLEKLVQEEREKQGSSQLQSSILERGDPAMDQSQLVDSLRKELAELERDSQELTEENLDLLSQLKQANDKWKEKDEIIAKIRTESKASFAGSVGKPDMDILDNLREKLRASEEARSSLEIQSESLLERATKAEDDISNALKAIKKLEAAHERLEEEKSKAVETLKKQLREINGQLANAEENYHGTLQAMESLQAEKEAETSAFLLEIEQIRASVTQFQDINGILQEQLQQEQQKTSKVMQQNKDLEAEATQLHQALDASQAQVKAMELVMMELKSMQKALETEMQEKDQLSRSRIRELELCLVSLQEETNGLSMSRDVLEAEVQELRLLKEKQMLQEDDIAWSKESKSGLEENMAQVQEVNSRASTRRPLEEKNSDSNELLQKQTNDFSWKLSEKEGELQELKKRVLYLEDELHRKGNALASAERRLKEQKESFANDGSSQVSYLTRSLSRANSRVGAKPSIPPSREAKELFDLRSKVKLLEGEVKKKAAELEAAKQQSQEQFTQMSMRIERLELANEDLVKEHSNSNLDQALKELNNLKGQNAMLFQRENELLARLASQEALQSEVEILKEEKKELENSLGKFNAAAKGENILKRISTLETELAEVLESNNMYKKQLQSAFAKQQNVHAAALENLGSVDKVINDLAELKRRNLMLESELCDMKERYFNMSLQFAEVEAEREELVMAIRNLRGTKKFVPLRSAIF